MKSNAAVTNKGELLHLMCNNMPVKEPVVWIEGNMAQINDFTGVSALWTSQTNP